MERTKNCKNIYSINKANHKIIESKVVPFMDNKI